MRRGLLRGLLRGRCQDLRQELGPRAGGGVGSVELSQELGPGRVGSLGSAKSGGKPSQESRGRVRAGSGLGPGGFVMEIG